MSVAAVVLIVVGVLLCALSRTIADSFRIEGNRSTAVKMLGMADDYVSRLYRWFVCVLTGLLFIGVGVGYLLWP
jgi:hypothetical protein